MNCQKPNLFLNHIHKPPTSSAIVILWKKTVVYIIPVHEPSTPFQSGEWLFWHLPTAAVFISERIGLVVIFRARFNFSNVIAAWCVVFGDSWQASFPRRITKSIVQKLIQNPSAFHWNCCWNAIGCSWIFEDLLQVDEFVKSFVPN